jgi:hypothetical protein
MKTFEQTVQELMRTLKISKEKAIFMALNQSKNLAGQMPQGDSEMVETLKAMFGMKG